MGVLISSILLKFMFPHFRHEKKTPYLPLSTSREEPQMHFRPSKNSSLCSWHTGTSCLLTTVACFWQKGHLSILLWPYLFGMNMESRNLARLYCFASNTLWRIILKNYLGRTSASATELTESCSNLYINPSASAFKGTP